MAVRVSLTSSTNAALRAMMENEITRHTSKRHTHNDRTQTHVVRPARDKRWTMLVPSRIADLRPGDQIRGGYKRLMVIAIVARVVGRTVHYTDGVSHEYATDKVTIYNVYRRV